MTPFEIYVIHMTWGRGGKIRPVLAFIVSENSVDVYQITSKYEDKSREIKSLYFKIHDWSQAGLNKQSYVDTGTLISLSINTFEDKKPIGKLTENDKLRLLDFLNNDEE
jgi:hypothetical protein